MPVPLHVEPSTVDRPSSAPTSPIIEATELAAALRSTTPPVILDVRWSLTGDGYDEFLAGRIPGAQFVDLDRDLAAPPGIGGRHPLPEPAVLAALCARTGITKGKPVVVTGQRDTSIAARAWWLLRWAGHDEVRVLDGGVEAWIAAGFAVESGPAGRPSTPVDVPELTGGSMPTVDADGAAALGSGAVTDAVLLDARAGERYRGEVEPVDPVPGHIPGAVSLPRAEIHRPDGRLLEPAELREVFAARGLREGAPGAASCGSGVTACSLILAAEVVRLHQALYPGSYSGWCALGRPVEQG
jgi:thiosulfate/3-mercaptopyruvate sulfurtransferase